MRSGNCLQSKHFNPLPRKEGDGLCCLVLARGKSHFNPLPRKEGDVIVAEIAKRTTISIHSLVKRETVIVAEIAKRTTISIHSLVKRETAGVLSWRYPVRDFNPLPRKEGDVPLRKRIRPFAISIHSLVKRETLVRLATKFTNPIISIHSLVKRETVTSVRVTKWFLFQSTPS